MPPLTISDVLDVQRAFNVRLQEGKFNRSLDSLSEHDAIDAVRQCVLGTIVELVELVQLCNWKQHRPEHVVDHSRVVEEYVDALKYLFSLAVYLPVHYGEIEVEFWRKTAVVDRRLSEELGVP